jgi:YfiH family protein
MNDLRERLACAGLDAIVPQWDAPPGVRALVTTRRGGVSVGDRASFDLGPARLATLDPLTRAAVEENRRRLRAVLPDEPVWLEQVHGRDVVVVDAANVAALRASAPIADAAVTRLAGVPLGVRVADCLPVVLADAGGSVVAVAHAGWRGLAAGVVEATLAAMRVAPGNLRVWLGPAIGRDAFEVGDDVRDAFCDGYAADASHFRPNGARKWLADLRALAVARLVRAGVGSVASIDACTFSDATRFYSWRRDRAAGRFAALAWRAPVADGV